MIFCIMRAILRKIHILPHMASTPSPRPELHSIISRLRRYKPPPVDNAGGSSEAGEGVDDGGKVISKMGLSQSAAAPSIQTSRNFSRKRAAVLVCLFEGDSGDLRVILTKRASNLSSHSGDVSLPGGKVEEGDADDRATAMREAEEEIGLDPKLVDVVTVLEPFLSKNILMVVPVIGMLANKQAFKPVLNPTEVEAIFDAPLEMFLKDDNRRLEEREWRGVTHPVHHFDYQAGNKKFVIWGLTAFILIRAASVVYQRSPSFLKPGQTLGLPTSSRL